MTSCVTKAFAEKYTEETAKGYKCEKLALLRGSLILEDTCIAKGMQHLVPSTRASEWVAQPDTNSVLAYDDIIDSGKTIAFFLMMVWSRSPKVERVFCFFNYIKEGRPDPVRDRFSGGKFRIIHNPYERLTQRLVEIKAKATLALPAVCDLLNGLNEDGSPLEETLWTKIQAIRAEMMEKMKTVYIEGVITPEAFNIITQSRAPWLVMPPEAISPYTKKSDYEDVDQYFQSKMTSDCLLKIIALRALPKSVYGFLKLSNILSDEIRDGLKRPYAKNYSFAG